MKFLSDRLMMSAHMAGMSDVVADIGCDHAHMDIWLLKNGYAGSCIAMDVRPGPLEKARENLRRYGFEDKVELRLSDGFEALSPGEADCAILAGMGGALMSRILKEGLGPDGRLKAMPPKKLVLQPQSHIFDVRLWLDKNGWQITDEDMVCEYGKYYVAMKAVKKTGDNEKDLLSFRDLLLGPVLCERKPEVFARFTEMYREKAERKLKDLQRSDSDEAAVKREYFEKIREAIESL